MNNSVFISALALILAGSTSCGRKGGTPAGPDDFVAQYRDSVLLMPDILRRLPAGITQEDSARLIRSIADQWIDGFLIEELAASQIDDMDRIEQLSSDYRRSLIAESYRRKMRAKGVQPVDTAAVAKYYREHLSELVLERPIVKGAFIKIASNSPQLNDIRSWMSAPSPEAYDALENAGRREAASFRYFADRWVDFDAIADQIPLRLGDVDTALKGGCDFETDLNGTTYLLHISEFRPSGALMPEQYAAPIIEDRIKAGNLAIYEAGLIKALRQTAIEKNILKEGSYYNQ